jgi:integrase
MKLVGESGGIKMNNAVALVPKEVRNVDYDIRSFLNEYTSEKTKKEYFRDIKEFFNYLHNKELNELETMHVYTNTKNQPLLRRHVVDYRNHLMEKKNSAGTVNRKIGTVRNLYKYLQSESGYKVDYMIFNIKALTYNPDKYDVLSKEDVDNLAEAALDGTMFGIQLNTFIYLATVTSIRASAMLTLKKKDVIKDRQSEFYLVKIIDKREQLRKCPIESWLYHKICALCDSHKNELLFPDLTLDNVNNAIQKLAGKIGLPEHLRIVTHSLRKAAPTHEMKTTKNIKTGMQQTGHKSVQTFIDTYTDQSVNYSELAGIRMFRKLDEAVFEAVDKKDILQFLKETNPLAYEQLAFSIQDYIDKS